MHVFGLTGGIASGKSTVAKYMVEHGVPAVDADRLARDVVLPGTPGLQKIVEVFGKGILCEDGSLDRKALGSIVFADSEKRQMLNQIIHPLISQASHLRLEELRQQGHALVAYEAALLVENGLKDMFRPLVVVATKPEIQRQRVMVRDELSEQEADNRLAAQYPLADKVAQADVVIWNNDGLPELLKACEQGLQAIRAWVAQPT
jgi:dephospho-CoA kinase